MSIVLHQMKSQGIASFSRIYPQSQLLSSVFWHPGLLQQQKTTTTKPIIRLTNRVSGERIQQPPQLWLKKSYKLIWVIKKQLPKLKPPFSKWTLY